MNSKRNGKKPLIESTVKRVFGSKLNSNGKKNKFSNLVLCLTCQRTSRTFDPIIDISLEISFKRAEIDMGIKKALQYYFPKKKNHAAVLTEVTEATYKKPK